MMIRRISKEKFQDLLNRVWGADLQVSVEDIVDPGIPSYEEARYYERVKARFIGLRRTYENGKEAFYQNDEPA